MTRGLHGRRRTELHHTWLQGGELDGLELAHLVSATGMTRSPHRLPPSLLLFFLMLSTFWVHRATSLCLEFNPTSSLLDLCYRFILHLLDYQSQFLVYIQNLLLSLAELAKTTNGVFWVPVWGIHDQPFSLLGQDWFWLEMDLSFIQNMCARASVSKL